MGCWLPKQLSPPTPTITGPLTQGHTKSSLLESPLLSGGEAKLAEACTDPGSPLPSPHFQKHKISPKATKRAPNLLIRDLKVGSACWHAPWFCCPWWTLVPWLF